MCKRQIISPSLLGADSLRLADEITTINESQCDWLHINVMNGVFVPSLSFGFLIIKAIRPICQKPPDVHLMIVEPWKFINQFAKLGTHIMNMHYEMCPRLHRTLRAIHEADIRLAVTLNPHAPVELLIDILCEADTMFLMSINPGCGGQRFIEHSVHEVERLHKMIQEQGLSTLMQVDGGVNLETGRQLVKAGADSLVAGGTVFKTPNPQEMIAQLRVL